MPKFKSIKAYSVIFTDNDFIKKDDLLSWIFRTEKQAKAALEKTGDLAEAILELSE